MVCAVLVLVIPRISTVITFVVSKMVSYSQFSTAGKQEEILSQQHGHKLTMGVVLEWQWTNRIYSVCSFALALHEIENELCIKLRHQLKRKLLNLNKMQKHFCFVNRFKWMHYKNQVQASTSKGFNFFFSFTSLPKETETEQESSTIVLTYS